MFNKPTRSVPSTPSKRAHSASQSTDETSRIGRIPRPSSVNSTPLLSSTKKYKAPLSSDAKPRSKSKPRPLSTITSSPRRGAASPRPKTPTTPKSARATDSPLLRPVSAMDLRNIDPEDALVDFETVDAGDVSLDFDAGPVIGPDHGGKDKVLVSIRIRPTDNPHVWDTSLHGADKSIKLQAAHTKSSVTPSPEFYFDEILTGSDNKPVYNAVARSHVAAAMDGYNAVVFAYGQTASGKTFTLTGDEDEPGIIPRAMKDIFGHIKRTPTREYLLRCSYLEIYNEQIHDLLAPPSSHATNPVQIQGVGDNVYLSPLREEVVTSLKEMRAVIARGEGNRRTACTDWNERSSRSHSVFRVVIESRERGDGAREASGRQTPGFRPPTPGGPRLQAIGERSVQTSVLSLIDLAGSEKATTDKDRTREGKYINTSLLTLGSVIASLADNAAKSKNDHVPFRNSKLTRMLQPSLSGNARISVIATMHPSVGHIAESTSTLLFAQRIKKVNLNAKKKEVVDADALIERYRKEIEDLKQKLSERESEAPVKNRRLSAQQQVDEARAMKDLNSRIQQLTKLILTSQTVDESNADKSRPASPMKLDFDMSPYQLQQELLTARRELETAQTQILSLEAALAARPALPANAPEDEKDKLIADQSRTIRELEVVVRGYEDNLGEPLRAVKEDVEREWSGKVERERLLREEKEAWAEVLVQQLEKEKRARVTLENERRALATFVSKFDGLSGFASSLTGPPPGPSKLNAPMPSVGGAGKLFAERQAQRIPRPPATSSLPAIADASPTKPLPIANTGEGPATTGLGFGESLFAERGPEEWTGGAGDDSFEFVDHSLLRLASRGRTPEVAGVKLPGEKENFSL